MAGDTTTLPTTAGPPTPPTPSSPGEFEEKSHDTPRGQVQVREYTQTEGYKVDVEGGDAAGYKLAADGHTKLIPQPSSDPADPLNWSSFTKHVMLMIVSCAAFLPDYGAATGAVTLLAQAV